MLVAGGEGHGAQGEALFTAANTVDDTGCHDFGCPSFGYGVIGAFAMFTAPVVAVLGQLVTVGLGAAWPSLRIHPARLGLLGALLSWILFGLIATTL